MSLIFILSSTSSLATNCGRGILERNFDQIWNTEDPNLSRTFFSPMNRDIRRINSLKRIISDLLKRSKNENLSNDSSRT